MQRIRLAFVLVLAFAVTLAGHVLLLCFTNPGCASLRFVFAQKASLNASRRNRSMKQREGGIWDVLQDDVKEYVRAHLNQCNGLHLVDQLSLDDLPMTCKEVQEVSRASQSTAGNLINEGLRRRTFKGFWRGQPVAVKVLREIFESDISARTEMLREAAVHYHLRHKSHIVPMFGFCNDVGIFQYLPVWMNVEWKSVSANPKTALNVALGMATAVSQLHEAEFLHGDLQEAQFLMDETGKVMLIDFHAIQYTGMEHKSSTFCPVSTALMGRHTSPEELFLMLHEYEISSTRKGLPQWIGSVAKRLGTQGWWMDEVRANGTTDIGAVQLDEKLEVWHLGFLLWQVLSGEKMHGRDNLVHAMMDLTNPAWPQSEDRNGLARFAPAVQNAVFSCFLRNPSMRPTSAQVAALLRSAHG